MHRESRRPTSSRPAGPARVSEEAALHAVKAAGSTSRGPPTYVDQPANARRSLGLFKAKSGLDITQRIIELVWLASERSYLTFEMVRQAFPGDILTPDDMAEVCHTLAQGGVELVQPAAPSRLEESVHLKDRRTTTRICTEQTGEVQAGAGQTEVALIERMQEADHEMRQLLTSFGFAAQEHLTRAEKFIAHPTGHTFEHLVGHSAGRSRMHYLQVLPNVVKEVRALAEKTATAYREWRQALGEPNGDKHQAQFRKLEHELQQTFPKFCYDAKVIQEMIATAQNIADNMRASQRVLQESRGPHASMCHMPRVDVERQTIEVLEERVRMPCEMVLRNCTQLQTAAENFQQARCQLIRDHLHMVASAAATYSNRGLTLPSLVREGIVGLRSAVEQFGYRHDIRFSVYAACRIRQRIRAALTAQTSHSRRSAPPPSSENQTISGHSLEEPLLKEK
jgi:hypothetical protein